MKSIKVGPYAGAGGEGPSLALAMTTASARTKLRDFGDDLDFVANYDAILGTREWKKRQTHLTSLGYLLVQESLTDTMTRRLLFEDYRKRAGSLLTDIPVREPVFVLGLPRTGTTLLHRLLSLDTAKFRAPLLWELLHPVPKVAPDALPAEHTADRSARLAIAKGRFAQAEALGVFSHTQHIHEIGPELPEECLGLLTDCVPVLPFCMYQALYMQISPEAMLSAYHSYRRYLQLLSLQTDESRDPRQWMLKCPMHLGHATSLAKAFPGAKLIWTHRAIQHCLPSVCSLTMSGQDAFFEPGSLAYSSVGRNLLDYTETMLGKAAGDIASSGLDCLDVTYANLVANPIETVRAIYTQFGWTMTPEYTAVLESYLEQSKRDRDAMAARQQQAKLSSGGAGEGSGHTYSLAAFGIDERDLKQGVFEVYARTYLRGAISAPPLSLPAPPTLPQQRASTAVAPEPEEQGGDGEERGGRKEGGKEGGKVRRNTPVYFPKRTPAVGDCGGARGTGRSGIKCHVDA